MVCIIVFTFFFLPSRSKKMTKKKNRRLHRKGYSPPGKTEREERSPLRSVWTASRFLPFSRPVRFTPFRLRSGCHSGPGCFTFSFPSGIWALYVFFFRSFFLRVFLFSFVLSCSRFFLLFFSSVFIPFFLSFFPSAFWAFRAFSAFLSFLAPHFFHLFSGAKIGNRK